MIGCGFRNCKVSSFITEEPSFGSGELDGNMGTWEFPCFVCAREWERRYPGETAWPYADMEEGFISVEGVSWTESDADNTEGRVT